MKHILFFIAILCMLGSCKNEEDKNRTESSKVQRNTEKIDQLKWLLGTWVNENGAEFSQESWSRENDSVFTAFSFTQMGGETVFAETIALQEKGKNLLFTVATANDPNAQPVTFRMISSEDGKFIFENKNNDFPQRIIYSNPGQDSLHAWIEGTENGEFKKIEFKFSREKI
ncbi:DUF6265 family protein [Aequorivita echinoideorum]|uniref:DUF6265 domain-containing protein n=1 Tax=Aequorivita echinoideorum TaxID=1549647 RepID=A0ABS5S742_9FLAO|nr:DUF6265 family protein [Aequorivita echinoideorum]MBT0609041.1 hypothetical protein [Aequorivita echinoideorum]